MKTVLVTGASRGIGFATAKLFAQSGYTVYANYNKNYEPLRELSEKMAKNNFSLIPVKANVALSEETSKMFSEISSVDILINNAGISQFMPFTDMSESDWDAMTTVNLKSVFLCSKAVVPDMIRKKSGHIINISSIWGVTGGSCEVHYSASKAAVIGFTKSLAKELAPSGIKVNCIAPGVIDTDMISSLCESDRNCIIEQTPLAQIGKSEHIAKAALFLAESEFITGEVLNVNGGFCI